MGNKPSSLSKPSAQANSVSLILTFCVVSALLIYLVYTENFIFGAKAGNWVYPYFGTLKSSSLWIPLVTIILLSLMVFIGSKLIFFSEKMTLFGCFLIAVLVQFLINKAYPISLESIIKSDITTSFYSVAIHYSPVEILRQFNSLVSSLPGHTTSNMPGKILFFQFLGLFTSSPQIMGYLIIAFSTLGAPLVYGICKILFHDRRTAFYAFILYAIIPCKLCFSPILNTVTPVFILLCLYFYVLYIERKKNIFLLLLGAALYILVLFEPSPLVTGIIFIGILLNALAEKRILKKDIWKLLVFPILAFLVVYLLFFVLFSFDLFTALRNVLHDAVNFNVQNNRPYWIWVRENLKEFFYAAGPPIMMIFIYLAVEMISQWKTLRYTLTHWPVENSTVLSLLATFCVVLFLGVNRGEITRLWIYLAVFFQIPAAFFMAKIPRSHFVFFCVASTLAIQSIITLQRVGFVMP